MRRLLVTVATLLAITAVAVGVPAAPAGASTTWEWMFFDDEVSDPIARRQCRVFYSVDVSGLTTANADRLEAAAQIGAADMATLTGVETVYAGRWDSLTDIQIATLAPVRIYVHVVAGATASSMPFYGDTVRPKDPYGGEIILYQGPGGMSDTHLANVLRHEWGHQFNLGDTYDTKRNYLYSASAPASAFKHLSTTNAAWEDDSQRMGDEDQPWGDGDRAGLWAAGAGGRSGSCFEVIRPTNGKFAFRVLKALYGSSPVAQIADVGKAVEVFGYEAGANGALDMPGGAAWRAKGKVAFIEDAWTGLTGIAPTPAQQAHYEGVWDGGGSTPRPVVLAAMANSSEATAHQATRQNISIVFANVLGVMPSGPQLSTFTDWLDGRTYTQLADRLFRVEGDDRYEPGTS